MGRLTARGNRGYASLKGTSCRYSHVSYDCQIEEGRSKLEEALEKLASYEDIIDDPEKLKLIDELYLERCEEINRLKEDIKILERRAEPLFPKEKRISTRYGRYDISVLENAIRVLETCKESLKASGCEMDEFEIVKLDLLKELLAFREQCNTPEDLNKLNVKHIELYHENIRLKNELAEVRNKSVDEFANWLFENHKIEMTEYIEWYKEEQALERMKEV